MLPLWASLPRWIPTGSGRTVRDLLLDAPKIVNGKLQVPDAPGLGVHLNWDRVWEANRLYNALPSHDRDDAKSMQYLIPGWKYDHKKPALVR